MVNGTKFFIEYQTDGITAAFDYPYYLFQFSDLVVWFTDASDNTLQLQLNSDYTLVGTPDSFGAYPNGVTITPTPSILAAGGVLFVTRSTQKTQMIHFIDNDVFPAENLEHGLDKLTLMAQEQTMFLGMALAPPSAAGTIPGQWYANANPVAGGYFGWVWTGTNWNPFGMVSL